MVWAGDIQRGSKADSERGVVSLSNYADVGMDSSGRIITQRDYDLDDEYVPFYDDSLIDEEAKKLDQES